MARGAVVWPLGGYTHGIEVPPNFEIGIGFLFDKPI